MPKGKNKQRQARTKGGRRGRPKKDAAPVVEEDIERTGGTVEETDSEVEEAVAKDTNNDPLPSSQSGVDTPSASVAPASFAAEETSKAPTKPSSVYVSRKVERDTNCAVTWKTVQEFTYENVWPYVSNRCRGSKVAFVLTSACWLTLG